MAIEQLYKYVTFCMCRNTNAKLNVGDRSLSVVSANAKLNVRDRSLSVVSANAIYVTVSLFALNCLCVHISQHMLTEEC